MTAGRLVSVLLLAMVASVPVAAAQGYVGGCSQQCRPGDPDVNPGAAAEGDQAVHVILYARPGDPDGVPVQPPQPSLVPLILTPPGVGEDRTTPAGPLPHVEAEASPMGVGDDFGIDLVPATRLVGGSVPTAVTEGRAWGLQGPLHVADAPLILYWYVSADAAASVHDTKVGAVPRAALDVHLTDAEGGTLARTQAGPTMLVSRPGADNVYEYRVPLALGASGASQIDGAFKLGVRLLQEEAPEANVQTAGWHIHWGPKWLPRLIVPLERPLVTEETNVWVHSEAIFVRWTVSSAFGWSDVAGQAATARLVDAHGVVLPTASTEFFGSRESYAAADQREVVNLTWRVDPAALRAHQPPFRLEASVENLQGTYVLRDHMEIHFSHIEGASATPGATAWVTMAALMVGIGLAGAAARRD